MSSRVRIASSSVTRGSTLQLMPLSVDGQRDRDFAGTDRRGPLRVGSLSDAGERRRSRSTPTPTVLKKSRRLNVFVVLVVHSEEYADFARPDQRHPPGSHLRPVTRSVSIFASRNRSPAIIRRFCPEARPCWAWPVSCYNPPLAPRGCWLVWRLTRSFEMRLSFSGNCWRVHRCCFRRRPRPRPSPSPPTLHGGNEVPVVGTGSVGTAIVTWNTTTKAGTYRVDVYNMPVGTTASHIHAGAAGAGGPVDRQLHRPGRAASRTTTR